MWAETPVYNNNNCLLDDEKPLKTLTFAQAAQKLVFQFDHAERLEFQTYLSKLRISLLALVPFFVFRTAMVPVIIQLRFLDGSLGSLYQFIGIVALSDYTALLLVVVLELFAGFLIAKALTREMWETWRHRLLVFIVFVTPIGNGTIMYARSISPPCKPGVSNFDVNMCSTTEAVVPIDNYIMLLTFTILYQQIYPIPWLHHLSAWLTGLAVLLYSFWHALAKSDVIVLLVVYAVSLGFLKTAQMHIGAAFLRHRSLNNSVAKEGGWSSPSSSALTPSGATSQNVQSPRRSSCETVMNEASEAKDVFVRACTNKACVDGTWHSLSNSTESRELEPFSITLRPFQGPIHAAIPDGVGHDDVSDVSSLTADTELQRHDRKPGIGSSTAFHQSLLEAVWE